MKSCYTSLTVFAIIFVAVFSIYPELDIVISSYFYDEESNKFPIRKDPTSRFVHSSVRFLAAAIFMVAFGCYVYDVISSKLKFIKVFAPIRNFFKLTKQQSLYLISVMFLIPYFIIHFVLKPLWGRARPFQIDELGGSLDFTTIYQFNPSWYLNSFPSGHSSMAFSLMAIYYVVPEENRSKLHKILWIWAVVGASNRVITGGHYASDVIASAIITLFGIMVLKKWILDR